MDSISNNDTLIPVNKQIYFISETFPPLGRGGAIMRGYFAKFLHDNGWKVCVITSAERKGGILKWVYDYDLFNQLKESINIELINKNQSELISEVMAVIGDTSSTMIKWSKEVSKNIDRIVNEHGDGIIFANYPDVANLIVGLEMKKKYDLPLVLDFRDDFSFPNAMDYISKADHIFATTITIKNKIIKLYNYPEKNVTVIYNGYPNPIICDRLKKDRKSINIVYAGTIAKAQKPEILNKAIRLLFNQHPSLKDKVEVDIYGQKGYYYRLFYKKTLINGIRFNNFIPYDMLLNKIQDDSDIGFFSLADEKFSYATPTKLFDYINLELPILAAIPDGEAKDIITKDQIGYTCHFSDISKLSELIYMYNKDREQINTFKSNIKKIKQKYSLKYQVNIMSMKLNEIHF